MPLGTEVGLGPSDIMLDGDAVPPPKKRAERYPNFRPMYIVAKRLDDQDATWYYVGRPRPRPHCARWRHNSPSKRAHPQFSAHVCCGETAGWIKSPLGTEVGLGPRHIVLDEDQLSHLKRGTAPHFSTHVYCGQTAGRIKMPLGTKVGLCPGHIVLHGHPAPPKGAQPATNFRPMSIVAKRSPISAAAEHL